MMDRLTLTTSLIVQALNELQTPKPFGWRINSVDDFNFRASGDISFITPIEPGNVPQSSFFEKLLLKFDEQVAQNVDAYRSETVPIDQIISIGQPERTLRPEIVHTDIVADPNFRTRHGNILRTGAIGVIDVETWVIFEPWCAPIRGLVAKVTVVNSVWTRSICPVKLIAVAAQLMAKMEVHIGTDGVGFVGIVGGAPNQLDVKTLTRKRLYGHCCGCTVGLSEIINDPQFERVATCNVHKETQLVWCHHQRCRRRQVGQGPHTTRRAHSRCLQDCR